MESTDNGPEKSRDHLNHFGDNSYAPWGMEWEVSMTHARSGHSPCSCCWDGTPPPMPHWWTGPCSWIWGRRFWCPGVGCDNFGWICALPLPNWLDVLAVFFHPGLCGLANPSTVKTTLRRDAIHTWGLQSQAILHRMNKGGDLPERRPTILMLHLNSNLLIQSKFIWTYGRKEGLIMWFRV